MADMICLNTKQIDTIKLNTNVIRTIVTTENFFPGFVYVEARGV